MIVAKTAWNVSYIGEILELDVPGCAFENLRRSEVSSEYSSPWCTYRKKKDEAGRGREMEETETSAA